MFFFGSLADHIHAYIQILHQITSGLELNPHTFQMKGSSAGNSSCSVDVECVNEVYLLCCVLQHDPGSHQRLTRNTNCQIMNWPFHSVNKLHASQPEDQAGSRQHILTNDPQKPLMKRSPPPRITCLYLAWASQDNRTESLHVCLTSYWITHPIRSLWLFIPRF